MSMQIDVHNLMFVYYSTIGKALLAERFSLYTIKYSIFTYHTHDLAQKTFTLTPYRTDTLHFNRDQKALEIYL